MPCVPAVQCSGNASSVASERRELPLLRRMAAARGISSSMTPDALYPRLVVISGHYNVQLAVLAAMRLDALLNDTQVAQAKWVTAANGRVVGSVPGSAAVLAFELHQSLNVNTRRADEGDGKWLVIDCCADAPVLFWRRFAVRAVLQDGPGKGYVAVPLPCASRAGEALGGAGACTLEDFQTLIAPAAALGGDTRAWCTACAAMSPLPCRAALAGGAQRQVSSGAAAASWGRWGRHQGRRSCWGGGSVLFFFSMLAATAAAAFE